MATDISADAEDLAWDHTADTLEISPLLDGYSTGQSTFFRTPVFNPRNLPLTIVQTEGLLSNLESTSAVLRAYLNNAKESQVRRQRSQRFCCPSGFRQCLHTNILFLTAVIQALNLLILTLIDVWPNKDDHTVLIVSAITMSLIQLVSLVFIIMTSAKLVKDILLRSATGFSLVSNYIATLLLFSGLYTLTYRLQPSGWKFFQEEETKDQILAVIIFLKFLFFSVSKATLCGTDSVLPKDWYNYILVALQMLISFAYLVSILRSALSTQNPYQPIKTRLRYRRETSEVVDSSPNPRSYHDYGSIESR